MLMGRRRQQRRGLRGRRGRHVPLARSVRDGIGELLPGRKEPVRCLPRKVREREAIAPRARRVLRETVRANAAVSGGAAVAMADRRSRAHRRRSSASLSKGTQFGG